MSAAARACPACGDALAVGQEFCLTCGLRLPGLGRLGRAPVDRHALRLRIGGLALAAVVGAGVSIAATRDRTTATEILTATGGSRTVATPAVQPSNRLAVWPRDTSAWTIVLVSVPKLDGRGKAVAVAEQARQKGLPRPGVLDSSRFASLRPGYFMAFAGRYTSEPEATGALRKARVVAKTARVQHIVP